MIVVRIVETETISQGQLFDRLDVSLYFTIHLLGIVLVVVVLDSPVRVGDTVRCEPGLWCIESRIEVLAVNQAKVAWELQDTIDERSTLISSHRVGLCLCQVHVSREFEPVCSLIATTISQCVTLVCVLVTRKDTVI